MVGFAALVLIVPLALTSTRGWVRRLGRRRQALHRAVYVIAVPGILHYLWLAKAGLREPLGYAGVLALLRALRRAPRRRWRPPGGGRGAAAPHG